MNQKSDRAKNKQASLLLCTCPDRESAREIASFLVEQKLSACVNIVPGIASIYRWEGKIEEAEEHLLIIKTSLELSEQIQSVVKSKHPYSTPELVFIQTDLIEENYKKWLFENLKEA